MMTYEKIKKFAQVLKIMESARKQDVLMAIHESDLSIMREVLAMLEAVRTA